MGCEELLHAMLNRVYMPARRGAGGIEPEKSFWALLASAQIEMRY